MFHRNEEERRRDIRLVELVSRNKREEFIAFAGSMSAPENALNHVWKGMWKKEISAEGKMEGEDLKNYIPSLEEFLATIKKMNPYSTGGFQGLPTSWSRNGKIM